MPERREGTRVICGEDSRRAQESRRADSSGEEGERAAERQEEEQGQVMRRQTEGRQQRKEGKREGLRARVLAASSREAGRACPAGPSWPWPRGRALGRPGGGERGGPAATPRGGAGQYKRGLPAPGRASSQQVEAASPAQHELLRPPGALPAPLQPPVPQPRPGAPRDEPLLRELLPPPGRTQPAAAPLLRGWRGVWGCPQPLPLAQRAGRDPATLPARRQPLPAPGLRRHAEAAAARRHAHARGW